MTDAAPTDYVASGSAAGEGAGLESDDDSRGLPDRVVVAAAVVLSSAIVALPSGPDGGSPLIARRPGCSSRSTATDARCGSDDPHSALGPNPFKPASTS
jgi:hypothetical protein